MKTNRLSNTLMLALNDQITQEANAAQIYLAAAAWTNSQGFGGISKFLFKHANEERTHMVKIIDFILKRGAEVKISAIPAPFNNPINIHECFEKLLKHEIENTNSIYKIVKMSLVEEDWGTWNFLQWFVNEQVEEETLIMDIIDKINISGSEKVNSSMLYELNEDLEKI